MTSAVSTTTQSVTGQRVSIASVDVVNMTATATTRYGTTVGINLNYYAGPAFVAPAVGEQWYVERISSDWALKRKLSFNQTTPADILAHSVQGTYQIGSTGPTQGPLLLDGSVVIAGGPLALPSGTLPDPATVPAGALAYDGSEPVFNTGAAWSPMSGGGSGGGYVKPVGGIPASDLAADVQAELADAASAYQKPSGGIPSTDLTTAAQTALSNAASAYVKPSGGIPESDLASAVQADLSLAASAMQTIPNNSVSTAQLSAGGTPSNTTFLRGDNVWATPAGGSGGGGTPGIYAVTTSAAATLTLTAASQVFVFTGTTTTWTLPAVSTSSGQFFILENRGSGNITLVPAGTDHIYHRAAVTSVTIAPGSSYEVICDGTYWLDAYPAVYVDNQRWFVNAADTTKVAQFSCAAITTGTTRTLTLPNANGTLETQANKGVANGYAELGAGGLVPTGQLGTGTANNSSYLRGDGTWSARPVSSAYIARSSSTVVPTVTTGFVSMPTNFWDTNVQTTSDYTVNLTNGTITVSATGTYFVYSQVGYGAVPAATSVGTQLCLVINGTPMMQAPVYYNVTAGNLAQAVVDMVPATFITQANAGDALAIGYASGNAGFKYVGESSATVTIFQVARLN